MQPAYIVPAAEWESLTVRLARLEAAEQARTVATTTAPDEVLSTARAAEYLGLSPCALRRARRRGQLPGVRVNEKDWGFRQSVLDAYPRRYHRATQPAAQAA